MIDTHCHLNLMINKEFSGDLSDAQVAQTASIIDQAAAAGITDIITIGTNEPESLASVKLAHAYPRVYAAIGLHPTNLTASWRDEFNCITALFEQKEETKLVGVGETGIDLYHPGLDVEEQAAAFHAHIELALKHHLPIIVHTRQARDETLNVLTQYKNQLFGGVVHCFPYDSVFADEIISLGMYLGIGGVVTYPNSKLPLVVQHVGLEHIVLETDAPYLAPQAMRGTPNKPAYIALIAQAIATFMDTSVDTVDEITTRNAQKLFNLKSG